ncbi:hypothetical protein QCA50_021144 [Cerrena zonata]|uniref:Uncharacterized protein n=1 Tax=Cerrena zonata TaxID=2478898 RepID=A0AAW0FGY5_9APHY
MSQPPDEHPPGRTPNVLIPTQLDEVRNLTLDDLPHTADRFLEPHDEPLPGKTNVYVVWRGRVPGLYYRCSTPVSSTSSLSQSTLAERRSNTSRPSTRVADINTEAGPSSGVRQQPRNTWYFEGDEQDCGERNWYEGKYFVVVVGLSPGVYRHMGTARVASGLLPDTVICTAASEEEANAMFVAEYMRQRVRRLRD